MIGTTLGYPIEKSRTIGGYYDGEAVVATSVALEHGMTYEYRQMTIEERSAAVEERRQRGYPLHSPPHPFREAGWYCITAANFKHAHTMTSPNRLTAFEDQLLLELVGVQAEIGGWVILTNHTHCLMSVQSLEQISVGLRHLHGATARAWNLEDGLTGQRSPTSKQNDRDGQNLGTKLHLAPTTGAIEATGVLC